MTDEKGGFYAVETTEFFSPIDDHFVKVSVIRFVRQAQRISKLSDWNDIQKTSLKRETYLNVEIQSEEKIRRGDSRGILLKATFQIEGEPLIHLLNWTVVTKRDNYLVQLIADEEAWEEQSSELTELVLSFLPK